jgi:DNA-directed RNA polymerase subunit RPC12/RpoP
MPLITCPRCNLRRKRGKAADLVGGVNIPEVLMKAAVEIKCEHCGAILVKENDREKNKS